MERFGSEQQVDAWHRAVQLAHEDIPLTPEFPQVSRLIYIDEGSVRFAGVGIQELGNECVRLASVMGSNATRLLIASLLKASIEAQQKNGEVVVHPFGWAGRRKIKRAK